MNALPNPRPDAEQALGQTTEGEPMSHLRLFVAGSTPNSVRARDNLAAAFTTLGLRLEDGPVEVIDVFGQPKLAMRAGVMVTPTLIFARGDERMVIVGDLADAVQLRSILLRLVR
jgi:hypothetical protein